MFVLNCFFGSRSFNSLSVFTAGRGFHLVGLYAFHVFHLFLDFSMCNRRFRNLLSNFLPDGFRFLLLRWGHVLLLLGLSMLLCGHSLGYLKFTLLLLEPQVLNLFVPVVGLFCQTFNCNVLHFGLFLKHLEFFVNWAGFLLHTHVHAALSFVLLQLVS